MKILDLNDIEAVSVEMAGASVVDVRVFIGQSDGAPNFTMCLFEVAAGGRTPYHRHDYEHEVFVLSGRGSVRQGDGRTELSAGTAVLVEPMEWHGFEADGQEGMRMLCMVPNRAYVPGQFRVDEGAWVPGAGSQEPAESPQSVQSTGQPASVSVRDAEELAGPWLDLSVLPQWGKPSTAVAVLTDSGVHGAADVTEMPQAHRPLGIPHLRLGNRMGRRGFLTWGSGTCIDRWGSRS